MPNWSRFTPADFEYDFENDELDAHHITFNEAIECFFSDFEIRRNKSYKDRYQLIGKPSADAGSKSSSNLNQKTLFASLLDGNYDWKNKTNRKRNRPNCDIASG